MGAYTFQSCQTSADLRLICYSPLCVEEFDLSDRNFKPCPCGYQVRLFDWGMGFFCSSLIASSKKINHEILQICQFCFNNIRTNLNGLCPACRRPYDDSTIEYKVISPDEYVEQLSTGPST